MMRIINDGIILSFLDRKNFQEKPTISTKQIQVHLDFKCTCKITQDGKGNWLMPCLKHSSHFNMLKNGKILK